MPQSSIKINDLVDLPTPTIQLKHKIHHIQILWQW